MNDTARESRPDGSPPDLAERYLEAIGLRDTDAIRRALEEVQADGMHPAGRRHSDSDPLVLRVMDRVEEWAGSLAERLGSDAPPDVVLAVVFEQLHAVLGAEPSLFLSEDQALVDRLRERLRQHLRLAPHDDNLLPMPAHALEELPGIFREDTWREFLFAEMWPRPGRSARKEAAR